MNKVLQRSKILYEHTDVEHATDTAAQEVAARCAGHAAHAGRRGYVSRGGLGPRLCAPRGGAAHARRDRKTQGQPSTLLGQSASQGTHVNTSTHLIASAEIKNQIEKRHNATLDLF